MNQNQNTVRLKNTVSYKRRLILAAVFFLCFVLIAFWMNSGGSQSLDDSVRFFVYNHRNSLGNVFWPLFTHLADGAFIVAVVLILVVIPHTRFRYGFSLGIPLAVQFVFYKVLKSLFARPRPDSTMWLVQEDGFSFPSGHTMNGLFFYVLLFLLVLRHMKPGKLKNVLMILFILMPPLIAWSRLYVGVHYFTDVLAGICMGTAALMVLSILEEECEKWTIRKGLPFFKN